jgi:hypothetical protein
MAAPTPDAIAADASANAVPTAPAMPPDFGKASSANKAVNIVEHLGPSFANLAELASSRARGAGYPLNAGCPGALTTVDNWFSDAAPDFGIGKMPDICPPWRQGKRSNFKSRVHVVDHGAISFESVKPFSRRNSDSHERPPGS